MNIFQGTLFFCLLSITALNFDAAHAQEVELHAPFYKLTNTGVLKHSGWGEGFEMIFDIDETPEDGLYGATIKRDMLILCKTWAPQVTTHIKNSTGNSNPKFLAVTVKSGTNITGLKAGRYIRIPFATDGENCKGKIKK